MRCSRGALPSTSAVRFRGALLGLVVWALSGLAAAAAPASNPFAAAESLYDIGDYDGAVVAARRLNTAAGHALAARALLSKATTEVPFDKRVPVLREADKEADAAIAADPKVLEGHLQKLVSFSNLDRRKGETGEKIKGAAAVSRKMVDAALAIAPNDAFALAALGGWHLEIVRRAPMGLGKMMFGASRADGIAAYDKALAADPANVITRYEYAVALLSLDAKRYRAKAETVLNEAIAQQQTDAYGRVLQQRGKTMLALLASGDAKKLEAVLAGYRGDAPEVADATATPK